MGAILLVIGYLLTVGSSFLSAGDAGYAAEPSYTLPFIGLATLCISFLALIVSGIETTSSVLLGWRADRRQSDEFKLKIQQLELQLAETKATAEAKHVDTVI